MLLAELVFERDAEEERELSLALLADLRSTFLVVLGVLGVLGVFGVFGVVGVLLLLLSIEVGDFLLLLFLASMLAASA